ncbi:MAG: (2Fe-2S)-binding protein [bacterium]|nr:(2Fe-2S)-binding protein [bacterium]
MARLTIDGSAIEVADGTSLFDACRLARGEALPHFCYHPDLSIAGVCRLCQVEVEGMPKLTIACNTTVREGMVVQTRSEKVRKASQQILEMHLINHPVDCPICDQAGECGLQNQYMDYGLYDSQVPQSEKVLKAKAQVIGPEVILDKERCVLCSRCVRFCNEVTKTGELGIFNRGDRAEIGVAPGRQLDNAYSVNTVDICPVGALTSRDFRFQKRVWMLKSTDSVCPGCATGCNVRVDHEAGRIYRLKPRRNAKVNGSWMCDEGRLTYKAVHAVDRLTEPLWHGQVVAWAEVKNHLARVGGSGFALVIGSAHQSLEELWLLRQVAGTAATSGGLAGSDTGRGDDILLSGDRTPNRGGLAVVGLAEHGATELAALIRAARGAILVHGGDPAAAPEVAAALAGRDDVVYLGTHLGTTARAAALVLPGAMWAEKAGVFVNRQARLQAFAQAVARPGNAREDWRVLVEMLPAGAPAAPTSLKALRAGAGAALVPTLDLDRLPQDGALPGGEA